MDTHQGATVGGELVNVRRDAGSAVAFKPFGQRASVKRSAHHRSVNVSISLDRRSFEYAQRLAELHNESLSAVVRACIGACRQTGMGETA